MFTSLIATHADGWGHHGPGPWALIPLTFFLVWIAVLVAAVWRFRRGAPWARHNGQSLLAERYARGDITAEEYRARRDVLKEQTR